MAFCVILYPDSKGNEAVSVAPASPGNHLAARLETPSDVHFLIKKEIWKQRTTNIPVNPASWVAS